MSDDLPQPLRRGVDNISHCSGYERMGRKIALFCTVPPEAVIEVQDEPTIYNVPVSLHRQGLDALILRYLGLSSGRDPDLSDWHRVVDRFMNAPDAVEIALVGKYV